MARKSTKKASSEKKSNLPERTKFKYDTKYFAEFMGSEEQVVRASLRALEKEGVIKRSAKEWGVDSEADRKAWEKALTDRRNKAKDSASKVERMAKAREAKKAKASKSGRRRSRAKAD